MKMNKPEGVATNYLLPKYFTDLHKEVLEILGDEKCLQLNNILDAHETFSFRPIATYLKRVRVKTLLSEGTMTVTEIAKDVNMHPESIRLIQTRLLKKKTFQ